MTIDQIKRYIQDYGNRPLTGKDIMGIIELLQGNFRFNTAYYDASSLVFPSKGVDGSSFPKRGNAYIISIGGTVAGTYLAEGAIIMALRDNPLAEYSINGWRLI